MIFDLSNRRYFFLCVYSVGRISVSVIRENLSRNQASRIACANTGILWIALLEINPKYFGIDRLVLLN